MPAPSLREIRLHGREAQRWRRDLTSWLQLESEDGSLKVGNASITFTDASQLGVRATLVFVGPFEADLDNIR